MREADDPVGLSTSDIRHLISVIIADAELINAQLSPETVKSCVARSEKLSLYIFDGAAAYLGLL